MMPGYLILYATRYALGRMTYAVHDMASYLVASWPEIDAETRWVIQLDIEEAFRRDDGARANGHKSNELGMDMDRAEWAKVRALWQGAT